MEIYFIFNTQQVYSNVFVSQISVLVNNVDKKTIIGKKKKNLGQLPSKFQQDKVSKMPSYSATPMGLNLSHLLALFLFLHLQVLRDRGCWSIRKSVEIVYDKGG